MSPLISELHFNPPAYGPTLDTYTLGYILSNTAVGPGANPLYWDSGFTVTNLAINLEAEPLAGRTFLVSSLALPVTIFEGVTQLSFVQGSGVLPVMPQQPCAIKARLYKGSQLLTQLALTYELSQSKSGVLSNSPLPGNTYFTYTYATDIWDFTGELVLRSGDRLSLQVDFDTQSTAAVPNTTGVFLGMNDVPTGYNPNNAHPGICQYEVIK